MERALELKLRRSAAPALSAGVSVAAASIMLAGLAAGLFGQGAYVGWTPWLVGLSVAAAGLLAFACDPGRAADLCSTPVRAAGLLAGWAVIDAGMHASVLAGIRQALLLAGFAAVLITCRRLSECGCELLLDGLIAVGLVLTATGWLGVVLHRRPWGLVAQGLWRASSAITYPNATAAVLVLLALIVVARLVSRPRSKPLGLAATALLTGIGATGSRAGMLTVAVGMLVLAALLGPRMLARSVLAPGVGAAIALIGMLPSIPVASPRRPGLAALALLIGLAFGVALPRLTRRAAAVTASGVAILAVSGICLAAPLSAAARAVSGPRATLASSDRVDAMRAALRLVASSPLTGSGPSQARLIWTRADGTAHVIHYAHNEYLQLVAELGLIGGALLALLVVVIVRLLRSGHSSGQAPPLWAGVVAGIAALAAHSGIDFLWHLPAIPLTAAALIGLATRDGVMRALIPRS
jgi:hypothetical protein